MDFNLTFVGIIPARFASTRFPGKALADIFGKPMVQHVYEKAKEVFDLVYVATDDQRIFDTVVGFGGQAVITDVEHKSGTDRCAEAVEIIQKQLNTKIDVVVNIQGDEPFINAEQLQLVKNMFLKEDIQIATLVKPFADNEDIFNSNSPKVVINNQSYALYFSRSPIPFVRGDKEADWQKQFKFLKHIGLYAYKVNILKELTLLPQGILEQTEQLEQLRWLEYGYKIKVAETDISNYAIDTPGDLKALLGSKDDL